MTGKLIKKRKVPIIKEKLAEKKKEQVLQDK